MFRAKPWFSALPRLAAAEPPRAAFRCPPVRSSDLTGIRRPAIHRCSTDLQSDLSAARMLERRLRHLRSRISRLRTLKDLVEDKSDQNQRPDQFYASLS